MKCDKAGVNHGMRTKEDFSERMWSLQDHLTSRRGRTETKVQYGPKQAIPTAINLIDPFASTDFRPSSAPIVHAVQLKFEAQKRAEYEAKLELGERPPSTLAQRPPRARS